MPANTKPPEGRWMHVVPEGKNLTCSICFRPIPNKRGWKLGNNAEPVNEGRCCDVCNNTVVIPARLNQAFGRIHTEE